MTKIFEGFVVGVVIGIEVQYYLSGQAWWSRIQPEEVIWLESEEFYALEDLLCL